MPLNKVWVFGEAAEAMPVTVTLELLTKAREIGTEVASLYVGAGTDEEIAELGRHGAQKVYVIDPGDKLPGDVAATAIKGLIESESPDVVLFPATYNGRDVCGFLSAKLDSPVITNGLDLAVEGDEVRVITQVFGGTTVVTTAFRAGKPHLAIYRAKSFAAEAGGDATPEVVKVDLPEDATSPKILEHHVEKSEGPKLEEAAIVVSGGRGLGAAENYKLIEELAEVLKAAKGASRAIVDAGWVPYSYQVGQTGKTVKPRVYIACGISGAMQHMVGMKDSDHIIAINKDAEAPIFGIASLGVVGDVHKVIPQLIEALKKR